MREPRLGDVVISKWREGLGRVDIVTTFEGVVVIGVRFPGVQTREFYATNQLEWDREYWRVKQ